MPRRSEVQPPDFTSNCVALAFYEIRGSIRFETRLHARQYSRGFPRQWLEVEVWFLVITLPPRQDKARQLDGKRRHRIMLAGNSFRRMRTMFPTKKRALAPQAYGTNCDGFTALKDKYDPTQSFSHELQHQT